MTWMQRTGTGRASQSERRATTGRGARGGGPARPLRARALSGLLGAGLVAVAVAAGPGVTVADAAKAPKRVVTLTPFTSNVTARLGVRPIAVGAGYNSIPAASGLRGVPRLKLSHPAGPNLETLIRIKPDL
ncbi:MAG: ABC transporter substrate-binding protein, partial [Patulibacter sp.]|nr:ABC transporter substrate-binding protein [Patulibacter sp.]